MLLSMKPKMQATPELAKKISGKLQQLLASHKPMNQRDLAIAIGVPTMVLNRAIRGESTPTAEALVKIAQYFRITTDELLGLPPGKHPRRSIAS